MRETEVVGLYVHGLRSSREGDTAPTAMLAMQEVEAVQGQGIRQDSRYFRRGDPGRERKRQISLIDEGTIRRHEDVFGPIERSHIKAQIILGGDVDLPGLVGARLEFEDGPELVISVERVPCFAMDLIAPGLREAMIGGHQGALTMVLRGGLIRLGQRVRVSEAVEGSTHPQRTVRRQVVSG